MFSIEILDKSRPVGRGRILIGTFQEEFEMSFEYWTGAEYQRQWSNALDKALTEGTPVALITSLTDPATANYLSWWPIYPIGRELVFQNAILFLNELSERFDLDRYECYVSSREVLTENGDPISEWRASASEVREFLTRARR